MENTLARHDWNRPCRYTNIWKCPGRYDQISMGRDERENHERGRTTTLKYLMTSSTVLSISSVYLSIYLVFLTFVYLVSITIHLSILSVYLSIYLSIYLYSLFMSIYPSFLLFYTEKKIFFISLVYIFDINTPSSISENLTCCFFSGFFWFSSSPILSQYTYSSSSLYMFHLPLYIINT